MSETILNGYLLKKINYQVFDEVITFLGEDGNKYTCMSLGSKKIESKNSRNLFFGSKIEFQFFQSRSHERISKLKKAVALDELDWPLQSSDSLMLLNEIAVNINNSKALLVFYKSKLTEIKEGKEDFETFTIKALREFCNFIGIGLEVNQCIICSSNILKTISFKHNGMLCNNCAKDIHVTPENIRVSKLVNYLFNNQYDQINKYYDLFPYVIKQLKQYIFDQTSIRLFCLDNY